ncbi:MAG: hypothetical protein ACYCYK_01820 [Candidatus Dormibacteria bacterium]
MAKPPVIAIDDLIAAVEMARDKVMADEVRSLVKFGIPKAMAQQMVAARFHQKVGGDEGEGGEAEPAAWPDMS